MASTPSSSALSAVLRCRGNIWARNPPSRRPATPAYGLGLAGGGLRDSRAERSRSHRASAWEAVVQGVGGRVLSGRKPTAAVKSPRADGEAPRGKDPGEVKKLCHSKLYRPQGDARAAVSGAARPLARRLTSNLPGMYAISKMSQMIKHQTCATHPHKVVFVKDTGVLKVSMTAKCLMEHAGQRPSFVLTGWSVVKRTCLPLTALVSDFVLVKPGFVRRHGGPDASRHPPSQQDDVTTGHDAAQAKGQIHNPADLNPSEESFSSGPSITEDRPGGRRPQ